MAFLVLLAFYTLQIGSTDPVTYLDQWRALSSRIRGLIQAGSLHTQFLTVNSSDTFKRATVLQHQCSGIVDALRIFRDRFNQLPFAATNAIDNFLVKVAPFNKGDSVGPGDRQAFLWTMLILLAAFETELTFLLSDVQESIRVRSDRAFSHLQRSIVVDADFRTKWQKAFEAGEIECEKLGAVHLLLHGIWAFKINAAGARTDLVFQEATDNFAEAQRSADGFVLTEWKKASVNTDASRCFDQARKQAQKYAQGALAASELTGYQYAVVVSSQPVEVPADLREGGVVFRHINISVNPGVPSKH